MENTDSPVDRIGGLPDSLLTHILSSLSTKEAINTCILSKRWTDLWAFVPVLRFQSNQFHQPVNISPEDQGHTNFIQFINGVFDHRKIRQLEKFSLSFEDVKNMDLPHIIEILDRAAMCMPLVMSVDVSTVEYIELPNSIFICASIEELSLSFDAPDTFIAPKSMNLLSLKKLQLTCLCVDDNFMSTILLGCRSLEELVMSCCFLDISEICSDKLKKLDLDMCVLMCEVHIYCPAVVSLRIKHLRNGAIRIHDVSPLARAYICFQDAVLDDSISKYLKLLSDLSNVASLRFHTTCLALQALLVGQIPKWRAFENLRTLELGTVDMKHDGDLVCCFLQQAPNLKKLILHIFASKEATDEELLGNFSILREYFQTIVIRSKEKPVRISDKDFGYSYVDMNKRESLSSWALTKNDLSSWLNLSLV